MSNWGVSKYLETKVQATCFYLIESFLENKKRSGTSLTASFTAWYLKKNISLVIIEYFTSYSINWPNFIVWLPLNRKILDDICIVIVESGFNVVNFKINLVFLIKLFFCTSLKSQDKNFNILRTKKAFKMK